MLNRSRQTLRGARTAAESMRTKHGDVSHPEVYANKQNEREPPSMGSTVQLRLLRCLVQGGVTDDKSCAVETR